MNWSVVIRDAVIVAIIMFLFIYWMPMQIHEYLNTQAYARQEEWKPDPYNPWEIEDMPEYDDDYIDPSKFFDDLDIEE